MIRQDIPTRQLASGSELSIPVFHFQGTIKDSKTAYIQSGIHGSEIQGYWLCMLLIDYFSKNPPQGDITIVPIANPCGLNNKMGEYTLGRFDPVTGDNWNRNYVDLTTIVESFLQAHKDLSFVELIPLFKKRLKSELQHKLEANNLYAKKLALQLQNLASGADLVLDLHCDTISLPHVYCPSYAMPSMLDLDIEFVVEIPHKFSGALDESIFMPWIRLAEMYKENITPPVEAYTIELGNQEKIDLSTGKRQLHNILNLLGAKNIISKHNTKAHPEKILTCKLEDFKTIAAAIGGIIINCTSLGNKIKKGEHLYSISNLQDPNKHLLNDTTIQVSAPFDLITITQPASPIIHEGIGLMKVMTNYTLLKR